MEDNSYLLTLKEASEKYRIGINRLRSLVNEPDCDYVLFIGRKAMIKSDKFTNYLSKTKYI